MTDAPRSAIARGGVLKAPFPYFGGKSVIAADVWAALGQPKHYLEPLFGSGAVLLARPDYRPGTHIETVCDKDGFVANVWRGLQFDPDEVAKWCDWPVNHADLSARKTRLIENEDRLLTNLIANDMYFDAKLAGYWIWAASCWIGSGLMRPNARPHLSNGGMGVHALEQIPHLAGGGMGVHALGPLPHLTDGGMGVHALKNQNIYDWFHALQTRLRNVRVVCGDWSRICGGNWQNNMGTVGIFFDPPYGVADRDRHIYHCDNADVARDVRAWSLERGDIPSYRIVLAGYDEHQELIDAGWRVRHWKTRGGYANLGKCGGLNNRHRETLYFSPHCCERRQEMMRL